MGDMTDNVKLSDVTFCVWAGQLSQYSDWLRAGRSRDRIPVGAKLSAPVQTPLQPTQPPVQWVPGLPRGERAAGA